MADENSEFEDSLNYFSQLNFGEYKGFCIDDLLLQNVQRTLWYLTNESDYPYKFILTDLAMAKLKRIVDYLKWILNSEKRLEIKKVLENELRLHIQNVRSTRVRKGEIEVNTANANTSIELYINKHPEKTQKSKFSKYEGPDVNGERLDDNFIDDVLGGEPDAYWNID